MLGKRGTCKKISRQEVSSLDLSYIFQLSTSDDSTNVRVMSRSDAQFLLYEFCDLYADISMKMSTMGYPSHLCIDANLLSKASKTGLSADYMLRYLIVVTKKMSLNNNHLPVCVFRSPNKGQLDTFNIVSAENTDVTLCSLCCRNADWRSKRKTEIEQWLDREKLFNPSKTHMLPNRDEDIDALTGEAKVIEIEDLSETFLSLRPEIIINSLPSSTLAIWKNALENHRLLFTPFPTLIKLLQDGEIPVDWETNPKEAGVSGTLGVELSTEPYDEEAVAEWTRAITITKKGAIRSAIYMDLNPTQKSCSVM
jgi:hypothetical protein